jgi:hypothetical protein
MTIASGTTITLGNSPTVTLNNTYPGGGAYHLINNGTITTGTGTATFNIDGVMTNNNSFSGTATTLALNGNFTNNTTMTFTSATAITSVAFGPVGYGDFINNGLLSFDNVTNFAMARGVTNNAGHTINTTASIFTTGGTLTNAAGSIITTAVSPTFNVGGGFIISNTSTFPGNITLNLNGLYVAGDSMIDAPTVTYAAPVTINRTIYNPSPLTMTIASGTTISLGNNPTVTLNNTYPGGGAYHLINNSIILTGTGIATFNIDGVMTNNNSFSGTATTLALNGNFTNNTTITFTSATAITSVAFGVVGYGDLINNGMLSFNNVTNFAMARGVTNNAGFTITTIASTFTAGGTLINAVGSIITTAASPTFNVGGGFIISNTSTFPGNITLNLNGSYVGGDSMIDAPSVTYAAPVTINRTNYYPISYTMTIASGTTIALGNTPAVTLYNTYPSGRVYSLTNNGIITIGTGTFTADIEGAFTNNGTIITGETGRINSLGGTYTNGTNSIVIFTGDGDGVADTRTISGPNTFASTSGNAYYDLIINATDGNMDVFQAGGAMTIGNNMTVAAGTFSPNSFLITGAGTNILDVTGTIRADAPTFGESYTSFETLNLNPGSTVDYSRSGNQAIDLTLSYKNLTISGSSGIKTPGGVLSVPDNLTIKSAILGMNGENLNVNNLFTINIAGTLRVIGSEIFNKEPTSDSGTVEYYGTVITRPIYNWNYTNACVRINAEGQTYTLPVPLIARNLNIAAGTLPQGNMTLTLGGILQTGGFFTGDPSASPANIFTAGDVSIFRGTFTSTKGTLFIGGNLLQAFSAFSHNSGTVDFNGSGAQALFATSTLNNVIHSGSGTLSITPANADVTGGTITHDGLNTVHTFTTSGTFVPLAGLPSAEAFAWGGGGAGGTIGGWSYGSVGAGAGAASGTLSVDIGTSYPVTIGGGGQVNSFVGAAGGGGAASNNNSDNRYAGGGGGYSGIFLTSVSQVNAILIAGGGGGGGSSRAGTGNAGGAGGGSSGQVGASPYDGKSAYAGNPGTQSAAGANSSTDYNNGGGGQGALQGGVTRAQSYGGGGGGGYWGGSAGGYSEPNTMGGGGGGSGYSSPMYVTSATLTAGSGTTPGDPGNALRGTAGNAGTVASAGSSGIVIIRYPTLTNKIIIAGNLINSAGILDANNQNVTLAGNWINSAVFIPGTDTVILNGTNQNIFGTTGFSNLKKSVSSAGIIGYEEDKITTVNGNATLKGVSGGLLSIRTVDAAGAVLDDGSQSTLDFKGTVSPGYLDVRDNIAESSNAAVTLPIEPPNSTDEGNTVDWFCVRAAVTGSAGANGHYTSLTNATGVFAALNAADQTGKTIVITLSCNSTAEDGAITLNAGKWTSLTLYPKLPNLTVTGTGDTPFITLNGASNVTIDGRLNASGTTRSLSLCKIRFTNSAINNVIKYCSVAGDFDISGTSSVTLDGDITVGGNLTTEGESNFLNSATGNLTVSGNVNINP